MAAAGYLEYCSADATFRMSREQAMVLANEDNTFFTGGAFQYAVACYRQIGRWTEAFRNGGGLAMSPPHQCHGAPAILGVSFAPHGEG